MATASRPTMATARRLLREVFGLEDFRPGQAEIIASVLAGHDTLAITPTDVDKSLCYQLPALVLPGTTVFVSSRSEIQELHPAIAARREFVVTTPDRLATEEFRETLRQATIDLVVVDEAHCVSQWGHEFRPACLEITNAIQALGRPPVLALSAIGTQEVLDDVLERLGIAKARIVSTTVYRRNLVFEVLRAANEPEKRQHLARLVHDIDGDGIVYAATVRQVDLLADLLTGLGFRTAKFHGRMPPRQRRETLEQFAGGTLHAIVATNALSVGIEKPDIRFVIHYAMPGSLEAYYSEAAYAGRDGEPARCILFHGIKDRRTQHYFIGDRHPTSEEIHATYEALSRLEATEHAPVSVTALREAASTVTPTRVRTVVQLLKDVGIVTEQRGAKISVLKPDLSSTGLDELVAEYMEHHAAAHVKLNRILEYAESTRCRWKLMLEYFGEPVPWERCGTCDACRQPVEEHVAPGGEESEAADQGQTRVGSGSVGSGSDPGRNPDRKVV